MPIIEGTVIRLTVEKLPSGGVNKPVWLWWSGTGATTQDVDRCWQSFLRRFDLEHTFRLLKQTLGWTRPKLRDSAAADRWTWLVLAAQAQLRLARSLAGDLHAAVGETSGTEQTHPCQGPSRVQEPVGEDGHASRCTETHTPWPRPPSRLEEPAARHPLRG